MRTRTCSASFHCPSLLNPEVRTTCFASPPNHIGTRSFSYPDTRFYPYKHWETNRLCEILIIFMKLSQFPPTSSFYAVSTIRLSKRLALCQLAELQSWKCTLHVSTESVYKASLFLHGNRTLSGCGFR